MSFSGVVLAGTAGSYVGSAINYWVSLWVGLPILKRYGKYFLLPAEKLDMAQRWVCRYGVPGILAARLLPVVRHLISIPAGILRMPFAAFSAATIAGSAFWCWVLAWFGREVLGDHPELLQTPEAMMAVIKAKLIWFVVAVVLFAGLYGIVVAFKNRGKCET
ncbi:MAG: DedA family protein, partial [Oligoflexia bacterium]|nr:DedA family protein [Oligoflexia bacterium]